MKGSEYWSEMKMVWSKYFDTNMKQSYKKQESKLKYINGAKQKFKRRFGDRCSVHSDSLCCMSIFISVLHVHVYAVHISMSMLHAPVHTECPFPCCMPMSILHVPVHDACANFHAACPCQWTEQNRTEHIFPGSLNRSEQEAHWFYCRARDWDSSGLFSPRLW